MQVAILPQIKNVIIVAYHDVFIKLNNMFIILEKTIKNGQVLKLAPTEEAKVLNKGMVELLIYIAEINRQQMI